MSVSGATDLLRKINDQRWTEAQIRVHTTQHEARYEYNDELLVCLFVWLFVLLWSIMFHTMCAGCVHHTLCYGTE